MQSSSSKVQRHSYKCNLNLTCIQEFHGSTELQLTREKIICEGSERSKLVILVPFVSIHSTIIPSFTPYLSIYKSPAFQHPSHSATSPANHARPIGPTDGADHPTSALTVDASAHLRYRASTVRGRLRAVDPGSDGQQDVRAVFLHKETRKARN